MSSSKRHHLDDEQEDSENLNSNQDEKKSPKKGTPSKKSNKGPGKRRKVDTNLPTSTISPPENDNQQPECVEQMAHKSNYDECYEASECPLCGKLIEISMEKHFETEHREFECAFCGLIYDSENALLEHISTKHEGNGEREKSPIVIYTCPVCDFEFDEQAPFAVHVDSHFNAHCSDIKEPTEAAAAITRTPSISTENANEPCHSKASVVNTDFELAQLLELQEREQFNYLGYEFNHLNEQVINSTVQLDYETEMDRLIYEDEQLEMLKGEYGMSDQDAVTRAQLNLDRAYKTQRINLQTYEKMRETLNSDLNSVYDSDFTRSVGVIDSLRSANLGKAVLKRYLCTECDHYSTSLLDSGYGCGYRNTQMLMTSIRADAHMRDTLFNNNNFRIPSILKLQQLIESAWQKGFDKIGRDHFNGKLQRTVKWIGSSDVSALLSSLRVGVELIDIDETKCAGKKASDLLINFVQNYFEEPKPHVYPIYLQHQGHSRTIVGIEINKSGNASLLIFDPSTRKSQIERSKNNPVKFMQLFRRSANSFKHQQYQLLIIKDIIKDSAEYEASKVLKSIKIS